MKGFFCAFYYFKFEALQRKINSIISRMREVPPRKLLVYATTYFLAGLLMNKFGEYTEIAKFQHWWQVISCYVLYMVPVSIILRGYSFFTQYCYGLFPMGLLEFGGYALGTSYVYPNNILIEWFGPYTFALGMTLFFALYFPLGNLLVDFIYKKIFPQKKPLH